MGTLGFLLETQIPTATSNMNKASLSNQIIPILLFLDGALCAAAGIFAYQLGIDPNTDWGASRYILLFAGIILILISAFFLKKPTLVFNVESAKTLFLITHIWGFIFITYAWFITYGNFSTWNHTTHYYTQLADGFNNGQLYLERKPNRALIETADLNDPNSRPTFDREIWDLSLYKEKFYLYWGPIPALIIAPLQLLLARSITDIYLVYFFAIGLLIFNTLIILKLQRAFFPKLPAWNLFICIPLIGFIAPIPWSLNIPQVYEAAIGAGQFFLMGGIYFSLLAFGKTPSHKTHLFLAGLCWACSVGSRAINVFSVIFCVLLICYWIASESTKPLNLKKYIWDISAPFIPLIFGALAIGWYNWARFDSPFEFGLRYQITIFNLNKHLDWIFQADYFFLNLYHYLFQPFEFISQFPFIKPIINTNFPETYFYIAGPVTGLLFSAPFLIFTLGLFLSKNKGHSTYYYFFISLLVGSFFINFVTLLYYFFSQTRFLVDVISQVALLAILGYWQFITVLSNKRHIAFKLFTYLANILLMISIFIGLLLSFSSETNRMETLNPMLFEKINSFFTIP